MQIVNGWWGHCTLYTHSLGIFYTSTMEIIIAFPSSPPHTQLQTLHEHLQASLSHPRLRDTTYSSLLEGAHSMEPAIIVLTTLGLSNTQRMEDIIQSLQATKSSIIVYPPLPKYPSVEGAFVASNRAELVRIIHSLSSSVTRNNQFKSIRMIAVKQVAHEETFRGKFHTLSFSVFRSKDPEFNTQMNELFHKHKTNRRITFNEIKDISMIPETPGHKEILAVSHADLSMVTPRLHLCRERTNKVFTILFNTSPRMSSTNNLFNLNVNHISIINKEIEFLLSNLRRVSEINTQKHNEVKSKANITETPINQVPTQNQKAVAALKEDRLYKLYILDNMNPKFKQLYQRLQLESTILQRLQPGEITKSRCFLLAPYEIKEVITQVLVPEQFPNLSVVLFDSTGGKDLNDTSITPSLVLVVKNPEEAKSFFKGKVKSAEGPVQTGRTVKFIEEDPIISGTSIDQSIYINRDSTKENRKMSAPSRNVNLKMKTLPPGSPQATTTSASGPMASTRKLTNKKMTMIDLIDNEPSIQLIASDPNITGHLPTTQIQREPLQEYYPNQAPVSAFPNFSHSSNNSVTPQTPTAPLNQYQVSPNYSHISKLSTASVPFQAPPQKHRLINSSRIIEEEFEQTVISSKVSSMHKPSEIVGGKPFQETPSQSMVLFPKTSIISEKQEEKPSQINSKVRGRMQANKNLDIEIRPEKTPSKIKEHNQVIQIMTIKEAPIPKLHQPLKTFECNSPQSKRQVQLLDSIHLSPSSLDYRYQRTVEDGLVKYVLQSRYRDEMVASELQEIQAQRGSPTISKIINRQPLKQKPWINSFNFLGSDSIRTNNSDYQPSVSLKRSGRSVPESHLICPDGIEDTLRATLKPPLKITSYSSSEGLYYLLQSLKDQSPIVVLSQELQVFKSEFDTSPRTKILVHRHNAKSLKELMRQIESVRREQNRT